MPHFTGFMYCLEPSLPLYLTIPSSIETNFDGRYSLRNVLASLSNKGRTLKSLSSTSRSNSLALLYSKQNFQREECMHFFACCCMPPQVWFCLIALFGMMVGFLHNRSSGQRRRKKSKAVPSSGTCEVGPVRLTNSSTWTGELSIVQCRCALAFTLRN